KQRAGSVSDGDEPEASGTENKDPSLTLPARSPLNPWEEIPRLTGDPDYETWWERHFEHTREPEAYFDSIRELGLGLRRLTLGRGNRDLIREAHMRRCIRAVLARGHDPARVAVVCGAMHVPALTDADAPMTDAEFAALPRAETLLTLMPYSYPRLSSMSGYG